MRMGAAAVVAAALLAAPASALGGGFATVGLSSLPDGVAPGEPWRVELTVLQHGRTPLDGVDPAVIVTRERGSERRRFPARPAGRPGVYRAAVTFPSAGMWRVVVDDGFTARHRFPALRVGRRPSRVSVLPTAASVGGGPNLVLALAAAAVAGIAAGLGSAALRRRS
jgi:YtkA-like